MIEKGPRISRPIAKRCTKHHQTIVRTPYRGQCAQYVEYKLKGLVPKHSDTLPSGHQQLNESLIWWLKRQGGGGVMC